MEDLDQLQYRPQLWQWLAGRTPSKPPPSLSCEGATLPAHKFGGKKSAVARRGHIRANYGSPRI